MASSVEKRTALPLPVFNMERFAGVIPILSDSSVSDMFRRAITISSFTLIPIFNALYLPKTKLTIYKFIENIGKIQILDHLFEVAKVSPKCPKMRFYGL